MFRVLKATNQFGSIAKVDWWSYEFLDLSALSWMHIDIRSSACYNHSRRSLFNKCNAQTLRDHRLILWHQYRHCGAPWMTGLLDTNWMLGSTFSDLFNLFFVLWETKLSAKMRIKSAQNLLSVVRFPIDSSETSECSISAARASETSTSVTFSCVVSHGKIYPSFQRGILSMNKVTKKVTPVKSASALVI